MSRRARLAGSLACLGALLPAAAASAADVRRLEAVGAVGLEADGAWSTPPRDAALRQALWDAVLRVALEELPDLDPAQAGESLGPVLGDDPFAYATRFRIIEDRGERAALLIEDPAIEREYVVVVEAYVDAARVRERLASAGLLAARPERGQGAPLEVVVLGVQGYPAFAAVRTALVDGAGARSATPVEISRGRTVFRVVADRDPRDLLDALVAVSPPGLTVIPVDADDAGLTLQVEWRDPTPVGVPRNAAPAP